MAYALVEVMNERFVEPSNPETITIGQNPSKDGTHIAVKRALFGPERKHPVGVRLLADTHSGC